MARVPLRAMQALCVTLANLGNRRPRPAWRFSVANLLKAHRIAARVRDGDAVLDVGCGSAHVLAEIKLFRTIRAVGVDLSVERVAFPDIEVARFDGQALPFRDGAFDVTLLCYVLHHLAPEDAVALVREAIRVSRRCVILHEDTLPAFGLMYRLRNRFHRLEAGLEYSGESSAYRPIHDEAMFLTYTGWQAFLGPLERVARVEIEPLAGIMRYRHHALIAVELRPIAAG